MGQTVGEVPPSNRMGNADAALAYARRGWPVFPLRPGTKAPLTARGFKASSLDERQIREWWTVDPSAGVGLECRGFVVLDIDCKGAKRGDAELVELVRGHGSIGWTWQATTPSGGLHYYYRAEGVRRSIGRLAPAIDVLGEGGYVVAPPTRLETGAYRWVEDSAPLAEPSDWLLERMRAAPGTEVADVQPSAVRGRWGSADDLGRRFDRALAYLEKLPSAISGAGGHDATWRATLALVRGFELPSAVALDLLRVFNLRCEPRWSDRELEHKVAQAARATTRSGYLLDGVRA